MTSLSAFSILFYPFIVVASFLSFLKTMEIFFLMTLRNFKRQMKMLTNNINFDCEAFNLLTMKYHNMFELNQEFNAVFGNQITVITCCVTTMATFQVI